MVKIGSSHMEEDNPKKAFECFEEVIKRNPNNGTDIYYHRGQGLHCCFLSQSLLTSDDFH